MARRKSSRESMDKSVPARSFCHEKSTRPGNESNSELPVPGSTKTTISIPCSLPVHLACTKNVLRDKVVPCRTKNRTQTIVKKHLKKVPLKTIVSPAAPSSANLEEKTNVIEVAEKADDTKLSQPTIDQLKLEERPPVKSSQFELIKKENLKLVDDNKKLRSRNEKYKETITKLNLHKSRLKTILKQSILIVNRNTELQSKNDEYLKTISELKQQTSKLEAKNLLLVDQIKELQIKNNECLETIKKLQKCTSTRAACETSTNFECVVVKRENDKICEVETKIKIEKNFNERIPKVENSYDDEDSVETESDEEAETDETETDEDTETDQETTTEEVPDTPKISSTMDELMEEEELLWRSVSVSPRRSSKNYDVEIIGKKVQSKVERCIIRQNDQRDYCSYRYSETKKRTWDEALQESSPEKYAKRRKESSSSSQRGPLSPFSLTGRKYGPFSQVEYKGEYAYASEEYLLLGDGVINGVLRSVLRSYSTDLIKQLSRSFFYFARRSIRGFEQNLKILPYLPKKVMISIGDIDSTTSYRTYLELKDALQSLFSTLYHKGVEKIVMIPPVKHNHWHDRRYHLDIFLRVEACTKYDWDYYYMQELSKLMSEFSVTFQVRDLYFIDRADNFKLMEKIVNYTSGNRGEESEAETSS